MWQNTKKQKLQQLYAWFNLLATVRSVSLSKAGLWQQPADRAMRLLQTRVIKEVMTINEKVKYDQI